MTLRAKVVEAMRTELKRQSEAPNDMDQIYLYGDPDPKLQGVEGFIDLEALADASLEAVRTSDHALVPPDRVMFPRSKKEAEAMNIISERMLKDDKFAK